MIPSLRTRPETPTLYRSFCTELQARGFSGELSLSAGDRAVLATDNSIYQVTPQAVAFPRDSDDLMRIAKLLAEPRFSDVVIAPRGGGTGTNGQSLSSGLVVDISRHMNRILEIDPVRRTARVQAGVVKDQLNAALKPHGLFFAPELSTSNRATIGGMISTDACGQGSCLYGKTRDHVLELVTVLSDGTVWHSAPLSDASLNEIAARGDLVGAIHRCVADLHRNNAQEIEARFPRLNRSLTGYDLAHIRKPDGTFDLNSVLCGSEGTLGFLAEAVLNLVPIPTHEALVVQCYDSFDAALRDAQSLMRLSPASIETVDSRVLELAQDDPIWENVKEFFPHGGAGPIKGVNLIEFVGMSQLEIDTALASLISELRDGGVRRGRRGYSIACGAAEVQRLWEMRKKAVGLLGNMKGESRPIAFVEDTAVPPERLADYILEFRAALDRRGLVYGMFGHVDAGVLHVRPAIDMKMDGAERVIREVTEEVVELTLRFGGLLWGEHGKGLRSEFSPKVFGNLYPLLQAVKVAFDPRNQFNPGKVAAPLGTQLTRIDELPTKGAFDRQLTPSTRANFDEALHCNGNGACFSWNPDEAMCPSWKGTRERRHSPKGRAQLMREWLRRMASEGVDPVKEANKIRTAPPWRNLGRRVLATLRREPDDFSHQVHEAMSGCLACKSCSGQCPIKVDVPTFRAKFLELYHGRYLRPLRHHVMASLETLLPSMSRFPRLINFVTDTGALRLVGLVHTPRLPGNWLPKGLRSRSVRTATPAALAALTEEQRRSSVVIVSDAFTTYYEPRLLIAVIDFLALMGVRVWLAPVQPNGKPLHVHGMLGKFARVARKSSDMLRSLEQTGVELVGIDPSMTLTYRSEYKAALPGQKLPNVALIQEWLCGRANVLPRAASRLPFRLIPHCTERSTAHGAVAAWQTVFENCGLDLTIEAAGCCGMAGTFGHEAEHRALSERIYSQSWASQVAKQAVAPLLADGFSCRSQASSIDAVSLRHPIEALLDELRPPRPDVERAGT